MYLRLPSVSISRAENLRAFNIPKALNLGLFLPKSAIRGAVPALQAFCMFFLFNKNVSVMESHLSKWHVIITPQC